MSIGENNTQVIFLNKPYFITTGKMILKYREYYSPNRQFSELSVKIVFGAWNLAECHSQAIVENKSNLALMGNITLNLSLSTLKQVREVFDNLGTALVNGQ